MMGDVRTHLYVRVEPVLGNARARGGGRGGWALGLLCLVPRHLRHQGLDLDFRVLISEDRCANINFRISISEDCLTKIDFRISISEDQLANIDFQISISKNCVKEIQFPEIDIR